MHRRIALIVIFVLAGFVCAGAQVQDNFEAGVKAMRSGDYPRAKDLLTKVIAVDAKYAPAYYNRAIVFYSMSQLPEAGKDLDQCIAIKPKYADAYNLRGLVSAGMGEYTKALSSFNKAIELDPKFGEAYINRGGLLAAMSRLDSALTDFNKAEKLVPNNPELYRERGKVHHMKKNYDKAVKDYTKAIAKGIRNTEIYQIRGNSNYLAGNTEDAISDFSVCVKADSENVTALNNRALAYERLDKKEAAELDREKIKQIIQKRFKPLDELKYKTFSDSRNSISIDLPDDWKMTEDTTKGETVLTISKEKLESQDLMKVGITFAIVPNMDRRHNLKTDMDILDYWKNYQTELSKEYFIYYPLVQKNKPFKGFPSYTNQLEVQAKPGYLTFSMYEFVCAYGNNLVYSYMQCPKEDFPYYQVIFEKALSSIQVNPKN